MFRRFCCAGLAAVVFCLGVVLGGESTPTVYLRINHVDFPESVNSFLKNR
jgi:hypothetical protein